jgi:hypothetical protein
MRIEKSPSSQLRKLEEGLKNKPEQVFELLLFKSKKDLQKRTYKTVNKGQYNKDKTRTRKQKILTCSMNNNDYHSLVQEP